MTGTSSDFETSALDRYGHLILLVLCELLSLLAIAGMTLVLAFAWDDVWNSMRVVWITYVLLLILTGYYAWVDYLRESRRLRGPVLNLVVLFGLPTLVFVSADLFGRS